MERICVHTAEFNCPRVSTVLSHENIGGRYGHVHGDFSHMMGLDSSEDSYNSNTLRKSV
jgi:hypothetical protein